MLLLFACIFLQHVTTSLFKPLPCQCLLYCSSKYCMQFETSSKQSESCHIVLQFQFLHAWFVPLRRIRVNILIVSPDIPPPPKSAVLTLYPAVPRENVTGLVRGAPWVGTVILKLIFNMRLTLGAAVAQGLARLPAGAVSRVGIPFDAIFLNCSLTWALRSAQPKI